MTHVRSFRTQSSPTSTPNQVSLTVTMTAEKTTSKTGNESQNKTLFCLGLDFDGKHIQNSVWLATFHHPPSLVANLIKVNFMYTDNHNFNIL